MLLRLNRKPKGYCVLKNWVTKRVYHENEPHSSSRFESFSGSRLVSLASKYSSVILTLKVYFISPYKLLFGCIFEPRLNSYAQYCAIQMVTLSLIQRHDVVAKAFPEGLSPKKAFDSTVEHMIILYRKYEISSVATMVRKESPDGKVHIRGKARMCGTCFELILKDIVTCTTEFLITRARTMPGRGMRASLNLPLFLSPI